MVLVFGSSSCGRNVEIVDEFDFSRFAYEEQVITIAILEGHDFLYPRNVIAAMVRRAETTLRIRLATEGIDFRVEIESIPSCAVEREAYLTRLQTSLLAGTGPDLFMVIDKPFFSYAQSGFLTDIYELIYLDPTISLDDFYSNVLEAFEFNERLIAIPMLFSVQLIGINSRVPESLIERFSQYTFITVRKMMEIFNDLQEYSLEHIDFGHLSFAQMIPSSEIVRYELTNHINQAENLVDMDIDDFVSFLEFARPALLAPPHIGISIPYHMPGFADMFVFSSKYMSRNLTQALMDVTDSCFMHYIPLVTRTGEMVLASSSWGSIGINPSLFAIREGGNRVLAWELLKELMELYATVDSINFGMGSLETPIMREHFTERAEYQFGAVFRPDQVWGHSHIPFSARNDEVAEHEAVMSAVARLTEYNEMPMVIPPTIPISIFEEPIEQFARELLDAETVARQISNRLWLWLHE